MAVINSVGNALTGSTGTGAFVGATSPTLVTPVIARIDDANGNAELTFSSAVSAVNNINLSNNSTGLSPAIVSQGSDTDIGMTISTAGAGAFSLQTEGASNQLIFSSGASKQHTTNFTFPTSAAARNVTWPDQDGTVSLYTTGSFTPTLVSSGGGAPTYSLQQGQYTQFGNRIMFNINLTLATTGTLGAGTLTIAGLPTAAVASCAVAIFGNALAVGTITSLMALTMNASTSITLYRFNTGGATALADTDLSGTTQFIISGNYII